MLYGRSYNTCLNTLFTTYIDRSIAIVFLLYINLSCGYVLSVTTFLITFGQPFWRQGLDLYYITYTQFSGLQLFR